MAVRLQMPCNAQGSRPCKSDVSQTSVVPRLRPLLQTSLLPWGQVLSLPNPPAPATAWAALVQISSCLWLGCIRAPTTTSGGNFGALFLSLQFLPGYKKLPSSIWGLCPAPQPVGCAAPSPCRPHTRHGGETAGAGGVCQRPLLALCRAGVLARGDTSQGQSYWGCSWALAEGLDSWA